MELFDLVIIGGGIHGCGVAVDAAGRGLRVALFEQNDLGSATSSASTKLIHGGLRYLESFEFGLVRQCLIEQRLLLENAAHLVEPLPFVIPVEPQSRPLWMIKLGLFFYDHLTRRPMPSSTTLSQQELDALPLARKPSAALRYYDCQTDDHRLVIGDALYAQKLGAKIHPRHKVVSVASRPEAWVIHVQGPNGIFPVKAKALVNTSGPWSHQVAAECQLPQPKTRLKLVQGSHLVLPKLYHNNEALAYQNQDGRLIFFVPYLDKFTLVGTTEVVLSDMHKNPSITSQETSYLLNVVADVFGKHYTQEDIVHHYAGVRALIDNKENASKATRDYKIEKLRCPVAQHPVIHILGGKITTWRHVSEEIVNSLAPYFPTMRPAWTKKKIIPGARLNTTAGMIQRELEKDYPDLPPMLLKRYAKTYGFRTYELIGTRQTLQQFGTHLAPGLFEREVEFLMEHEWAQTYEDIVYRRTKLGLTLTTQEKMHLALWFGHTEHEPQYS